jgi:hypothetical protein
MLHRHDNPLLQSIPPDIYKVTISPLLTVYKQWYEIWDGRME